MTTLLLAFGIMLILMIGMAVGVIAGREPIKGSCGGLSKIGLDGECEVCGGDLSKCDSDEEPQKASAPDEKSGVQIFDGDPAARS